MKFRNVTLGILATLLAAAGCSSSPDRLESGDGYSVLGALAEIPADSVEEQFWLSTADLAAAIEAGGLERGAGLDPSDHVDWVMALTAGTSDGTGHLFVPLADGLGFSRLQQLPEFHDELGFSLADADAYVEVADAPRRVLVVTGDVELSPDLAAHDDGYVSAGEGDDLSSYLDSVTAARPIGSPLRLAQREDRIISSSTTEPVRAWLDDTDDTLADDEELAAIATVLDEAEVLSAVIVSGTDFGLGAVPDHYDQLVPTDPFSSIGIGWSVDGITIAFAFADERAAGDAVAVFERQFAEGMTVRGQPLGEYLTLTEARADGPLVVLTVESAADSPASFPVSALQMRDLPFLHR